MIILAITESDHPRKNRRFFSQNGSRFSRNSSESGQIGVTFGSIRENRLPKSGLLLAPKIKVALAKVSYPLSPAIPISSPRHLSRCDFHRKLACRYSDCFRPMGDAYWSTRSAQDNLRIFPASSGQFLNRRSHFC